ncbi:MAG TPA: hypothetical protein VGG18_09635 [Granulicella sp.]|jgi:6-phosphogluconolactonase (cycloisomerase 2 family)
MALTLRQTPIRFVIALLGVAGALSLTGCGGFFQCEGKTDCPSTGTGTTGTDSGDYAYISNNSTNADDLSVYDVSTGALNALASSPISLDYVPNAMVMNPASTLMFVSNLTAGVINSYNVGSSGALTGGTTQVNQIVSAMAISQDNEYLYALDLTTGGSILAFYSIGSNGTLTPASIPSITLPVATSGASIAVGPNSNYLVVTLGQAGDVIVPLTNDQASTTLNPLPIPPSTTAATGDYGAAIDTTNNNVYFARTGVIAVYNIAADGSKWTSITNTTANSTTGTGDHAILIAGSYLYTANYTDGTISGFSFTSAGVLTPLTGSPYAAPTLVNALGLDNTGKYIVASGYSSSAGTKLYTIGSAGALTAASVATATGTSGANLVLIAMTQTTP